MNVVIPEDIAKRIEVIARNIFISTQHYYLQCTSAINAGEVAVVAEEG